MTSKPIGKRPYITLGLVTSGSLLACTGLAMLSWPAAPLIAKGWMALGVSARGIGAIHQVAAVSFLTSAALHITDRRRTVAHHVKSATKSVIPAGRVEEIR
jgi:hypothetical protein